MLHIEPISIHNANTYVAQWHRHNKPVRAGARVAIACADDRGNIHGVALLGVPRAHKLMQTNCAEVLRVATDGTRNACSILYARCAKLAKDLGYNSVITYTLHTECGASMRAVGWQLETQSAGGWYWGGGKTQTKKRCHLRIKTVGA